MAGVSSAKVLELLKRTATLALVRSFLKARGLASSAASWDQMLDERLVPRIKDGSLPLLDVIELLRDCEEHGRQHVFLYRLKAGYRPPCAEVSSLKKSLAALNLEGLLEAPKMLELPASMQLCDVRLEEKPKKATIIKAVETREYYEYVGERHSDGTLTKTYEAQHERAVNVARVGRDGLVEVRIYRQKNSTDYETPLVAFSDLIRPLVDLSRCEVVSIMKAKQAIWDGGKEVAARIRVTQQWATNPFGVQNRIVSQDHAKTLTQDEGSVGSMEAFLKEEGQHTACHATWLLDGKGPDKVSLNVALTGQPHEFAIGGACTGDQYETILADILGFNG